MTGFSVHLECRNKVHTVDVPCGKKDVNARPLLPNYCVDAVIVLTSGYCETGSKPSVTYYGFQGLTET